MTKVQINPGICGLVTTVEADAIDEQDVKIVVHSACPSVQKMMEELGDTFDSFDICLAKPGSGPLYEYAMDHFPGHAACPTISGITKCVEVECKLALPKEVSIKFVK